MGDDEGNGGIVHLSDIKKRAEVAAHQALALCLVALFVVIACVLLVAWLLLPVF